jgi:hypothetical protein
MAEVRQHHAEFGKLHGYAVEMHGPRVFQERAADERGAGVKKHGQAVPHAVAVDLAAARVARMNILV